MKKFPAPCIFLIFLAIQLSAQQENAKNYLALTVGPNYFSQVGQFKNSISEPVGGLGFVAGLHYGYNVGAHWRLQLALRYNNWHHGIKSGPLQFPSENQNGVYVYDPTLNHYVTQNYQNDALQLLCGAGWYSSPKKWQWNVGAELGNSFISSSGNSFSRFTAGLAAGASLRISRRLQWVFQPSYRHIFRKKPGYAFHSAQLETGICLGL